MFYCLILLMVYLDFHLKNVLIQIVWIVIYIYVDAIRFFVWFLCSLTLNIQWFLCSSKIFVYQIRDSLFNLVSFWDLKRQQRFLYHCLNFSKISKTLWKGSFHEIGRVFFTYCATANDVLHTSSRGPSNKMKMGPLIIRYGDWKVIGASF